jgi:hypothetical protein
VEEVCLASHKLSKQLQGNPPNRSKHQPEQTSSNPATQAAMPDKGRHRACTLQGHTSNR